SLHTRITEIPVPTTNNNPNKDPLAHILDQIADPDDPLDSVVFATDDGTNAHGYFATNDGAGNVIIFDTNIDQPDPNHPHRDPKHTPRVRTRNQWTQSYTRNNGTTLIKKAFTIELTQKTNEHTHKPDGTLTPRTPTHTNEPDQQTRQHK
ncbi:hypothetical protein, partial [Nocardia vinacea]|uniref:hypothetical protein n=1 Tax=Nocardia vinacea TaxID=96468 RepID=UPI000593FAC2